MIFGSWARLGLGIPPPGASEAQRHCGPAAEPGESAGGPRDPATPSILPTVSGVVWGRVARVPGPPGGHWGDVNAVRKLLYTIAVKSLL